MSKKHKHGKARSAGPQSSPTKSLRPAIIIVALAVCAGAAFWALKDRPQPAASTPGTNQAGAAPVSGINHTNLPTTPVAEALMVTVELDYGGKPPSIEEALRDMERRHEPSDGVGRTFAILDAYGEPTTDNKLHLSMHLSMEKPGVGALIFKRTGAEVWRSRIVPADHPVSTTKNLTIIMDDNRGNSMMLDGSKGISRVLDIPLNKTNLVVRDLWPDGTTNEFTYIYSMCGCPVKAKVRRVGETTLRSTNSPVMFPDDPEALRMIHTLMGWPEPR